MTAAPLVIQGGMGMGVSHWRLANAVSRRGQLGVVSGTALDTIFARRLQDGDKGGHLRRALGQFPVPSIASKFFQRYYRPEGRRPGEPYRPIPMLSLRPPADALELSVIANFAEVYLAKEGHANPVGINLLHRVYAPNLSSLYGAMLAGVDYVLMGAGIPREIPRALDRLAAHAPADLQAAIVRSEGRESALCRFDPRQVVPENLPPLKRPRFLGIVSSATLAGTLVLKADSHVDGLIVEGALSGGHNALPRGSRTMNARGEPVYGPRDRPDLDKIRSLGRSFWIAGSCATADKLAAARAAGAAGVQVGTAFAFCEESGLADAIKTTVLGMVLRGDADVFTDPAASPTGLPFKVVRLNPMRAGDAVETPRRRLCDLGYLRTAYRRLDGGVGYRCPSEDRTNFLRKRGAAEEAAGRQCLCNGLLAAIGLGQTHDASSAESPIVTAGEDLRQVSRYMKPGSVRYTAADVLRVILGPEKYDADHGAKIPRSVE